MTAGVKAVLNPTTRCLPDGAIARVDETVRRG